MLAQQKLRPKAYEKLQNYISNQKKLSKTIIEIFEVILENNE